MQTLILIFGEVLPKIWIVAPHISVSISLMDNSPKYLGSWVRYPKETQFIFDPTILDNNGDRILTTLISGSIIRLSSMVSAGVSTDRPRCCKKSSCPKITSIALLPLHMTLAHMENTTLLSSFVNQRFIGIHTRGVMGRLVHFSPKALVISFNNLYIS